MRIRLLIILLLLNFAAFAQENNAINEFSNIGYDHNLTYSLVVHTHGIGVNTNYFIKRTSSRAIALNLDIVSLKHPKETKIVNALYNDSKPYVYGKLNSIINIRGGIGNQFIVADRENPLSIKVNFNYSLGIDFVLLKPQYLKILYPVDPIDPNGQILYITKIEKYDPTKVQHASQNNIHGGAGYFYGFNDISKSFGAYAKAGFSFEWNNEENSYRFLECGFVMDAFPEALPVFAFIDNKNIYTNLYLNIGIGNRW